MVNRKLTSPLCRRCRSRRVYMGLLFCSRCRARSSVTALEKIEVMLAEYKQRRESLSVTEDPQVYFVLNAYVDVLLTIRAELYGDARGAVQGARIATR